MSVPWTQSSTAGTSNKIALILTEYPDNMHPIGLKLGENFVEPSDITIISQYYEDFSRLDEYMDKNPGSKVVTAAVLGYPCRQQTIVNDILPKIAGFWSKLSFVLDNNATIFIDQEFSCYSSFLDSVYLFPLEIAPRKYHFVSSSSIIKSYWLSKDVPNKGECGDMCYIPKRPFSFNYLLYLTCRYESRINPVEDVTLDAAQFKDKKPYLRSISFNHHPSTESSDSDIKRKYTDINPSPTRYAQHILCCKSSFNRRFTLLSISIVNVEEGATDYILLIDWDIATAQLLSVCTLSGTLPTYLTEFLVALVTELQVNMTRIKYCPSVETWQTYDDTLFRFITDLLHIIPSIDTYIKDFVPVDDVKKNVLNQEKALHFLKSNLFSSDDLDSDTFHIYSTLGTNLAKWFETLNSTYPNQVDLQISQYLVQILGKRQKRMSFFKREKFQETFCAAWVTWFLNRRILYPDESADDILRIYLRSAVDKDNFKLLLEFCRGIYLLVTTMRPPTPCLPYLGDQYANLFLR